jgi:polysaccharide export outer membrane protein
MQYAIKKMFFLCLILILSLLFVGAAAAQDTVGTPTQIAPGQIAPKDLRYQGRYRFGYQDQVEIEVYKHKELSVKVDVADDGTIKVPGIAEPIIAVCKTERELANDLTAKYSKYLRTPYISVRAGEQKSQSFAVIGAVSKPGAFFLGRRIQLLELLAYAGGPTDKAGVKVVVARTGSSSACREETDRLANNANLADVNNPDVTVETYDINDLTTNKKTVWMEPGDIVSVREADVIYVVGNVVDPKEVLIKKEITLSQAIAAAKGLKPSTKKGAIKILRKKPDSLEREVIICDLGLIEKAKAPDPILMADDIVAVSDDPVKSIMKSVIAAVIGGAGYIPYYLTLK